MKKIMALITATLAIVSVVFAAETTTSSTRSEVASPLSASPLSWLQTRGTISTDDVVSALGITPDKAQREAIEKAAARRNEQLQKINDEFSRDLQKTLAASDEELAAKVKAENERKKMATMRSRQPGRYNGVKKEKN